MKVIINHMTGRPLIGVMLLSLCVFGLLGCDEDSPKTHPVETKTYRLDLRLDATQLQRLRQEHPDGKITITASWPGATEQRESPLSLPTHSIDIPYPSNDPAGQPSPPFEITVQVSMAGFDTYEHALDVGAFELTDAKDPMGNQIYRVEQTVKLTPTPTPAATSP